MVHYIYLTSLDLLYGPGNHEFVVSLLLLPNQVLVSQVRATMSSLSFI